LGSSGGSEIGGADSSGGSSCGTSGFSGGGITVRTNLRGTISVLNRDGASFSLIAFPGEDARTKRGSVPI
jgi:hypothetical protein